MNGLYGETGKKLADARRGREWTRAVENWAKPRTRHTHTRTQTLTRTRERDERVHVKNWPTPIVDGNGPVPWKTCENYILGTNTHTDPYTDP